MGEEEAYESRLPGRRRAVPQTSQTDVRRSTNSKARIPSPQSDPPQTRPVPAQARSFLRSRPQTAVGPHRRPNRSRDQAGEATRPRGCGSGSTAVRAGSGRCFGLRTKRRSIGSSCRMRRMRRRVGARWTPRSLRGVSRWSPAWRRWSAPDPFPPECRTGTRSGLHVDASQESSSGTRSRAELRTRRDVGEAAAPADLSTPPEHTRRDRVPLLQCDGSILPKVGRRIVLGEPQQRGRSREERVRREVVDRGVRRDGQGLQAPLLCRSGDGGGHGPDRGANCGPNGSSSGGGKSRDRRRRTARREQS